MLDLKRTWGAAAVLALLWMALPGSAQQPPAPAPVPPILQNYRSVTAARLLKPDDGD